MRKIETIGVVGMGYVGLPLALAFAKIGGLVFGIDNDAEKIRKLLEGKSYINYITDEEIRDAGHQLVPTTSFESVQACDAVIICVPTPLDHHGAPDLSHVIATARAISPNLSGETLIVLESTTYPGTTERVLAPAVRGEAPVGTVCHMAYSPERLDPGNPTPLSSIPKVVAGETPTALSAVAELYGVIFDKIVPVSSCSVAESTKLVENIFRGVNIALVNELKVVLAGMGVDIWEVLDAASTKPYGFMRFSPGPGLGGHCIPIDPFYLTWAAKESGHAITMVELAGQINSSMPGYVVGRIAEALNSQGKAVMGASILLLGVSYKPGVNDMRESPSLDIWERLLDMGGRVDFYDPLVSEIPKIRGHERLVGKRRSISQKDYDAVAVLSVSEITEDIETMLGRAAVVVDAQNIVDKLPKVWKA